MEKKLFGKLPDGRGVFAYTMEDANTSVTILNYGGIIQKLLYLGVDIAGGFDTIGGYLGDNSYQGAIIGRYGNRIKDGRFNIGGVEYTLAKNNGVNHLHGGIVGYNRKIWNTEADDTNNTLVLTYKSPDGEEGYPGNLEVKVTYSLYNDSLSVHYEAVSDADTYVNLTNHTYFNLCGIGSGKITSHELKINADSYTEVDGSLIPTGKKPPVSRTPFDFTSPKPIGRDLTTDFESYDHNFILNDKETVSVKGRKMRVAASLSCCGRKLRVITDKPCIQLYTGYFLKGSTPFKGGVKQEPLTTVCLETQYEPDSPSAGKALLHAGEAYDYMTVFELKQIPGEK